MRKLLLALLLVPGLSFAQSGITLPAGSNTLKSLHFKGAPGLGIYSPSAGSMFFGNESGGVLCTATTCYFSDPTGTTLAGTVVSALETNAPSAANSIWGVSNGLAFEGATANEYESTIKPADPTADRTVTLADASGTVMLSTLATNAPDVANSVTGGTNMLIFEGATGNTVQTFLTVTDPSSADKTITLPNATGTVALVGSVNINRSDLIEDALQPYGIPVFSLVQTTGIPLAVTETAGNFNLSVAANVYTAVGEVTDNETETSVVQFQFVLPPEYVTGGDVSIRIPCAIVVIGGAPTNNGSTIDVAVYEQGSGAVGSDLSTTTAAATFAAISTWYNKDFVITPTALVAGDILNVVITGVAIDNEAGAGSMQLKLDPPRVLLDIKG
jgi:hypothetical protein